MANEALHTDQALSDYFSLEHLIFSSTFSDAYKAMDRSRQTNNCLLVSRFSLGIETGGVRRFLERMELLEALRPAINSSTSYAVDSQGMAFAILPQLDGVPVVSGRPDIGEIERRFTGCVHIVARLHKEGIVAGDLHPNAFWIERNGQVRWVSLMGPLLPANPDEFIPPREALPYIAPEVMAGKEMGLAADVFGLGVLAYQLFTGEFPFGPEGLDPSGHAAQPVRPVMSYIPNAPAWTAKVLPRCLEVDPAKRIATAGDLLTAIQEARSNSGSEQSKPQRIERAISVAGRLQDGVVTHGSSISGTHTNTAEIESVPERQALSTKVLIAFAVATALCAGLLFFLLRAGDQGTSNLRSTLAVHREAVTDPQLRNAIDVIGERDLSISQKSQQLAQVSASDDPLAHDILARTAVESKRPELRQLAETNLLERIDRLGNHRSSALLKQWLRTEGRQANIINYETALRLFDPAVPADERNSMLQQLYHDHPEFALKIAAALALDGNKFDELQPALAELLGKDLNLKDPSGHSAASLMLLSPVVSLPYGEDILSRRELVPDADVRWLVKELAIRNDLNVRTVAKLALDHQLVAPPRNHFYEIIRDRSDLTPDLLLALARGADGELTAEDVGSFGRWQHPDSQTALLIVCADEYPKDVREAAFDVLAGKSIFDEPAASLVNWIRRDHWDQRADFVQLIGVLSNLESVETNKIEQALASIDHVAKSTEVIEILLKTKEPRVLKFLVEKYPDVLGLGVLLSLLELEQAEVRIAAVKALSRFNDIGALKLIIDNYEKEKDPTVREVYRQNFWMIAQREKK